MNNSDSKDPENMLAAIAALPSNLKDAWELGLSLPLPDFPKISKIIISGMGGSAIGGDLFGSYLSAFAKIPVISHRGYDLTSWARGRETLVICSSHSGNTEETLSSFHLALEQNCSLLTISTGGKLEEEAQARGISHWKFKHQGQPRTAIGWSFSLLLALAERLGIVQNQREAVEQAYALMITQNERFHPDIPVMKNETRRLAGQLLERNIMIFASGELEVIARRWKTQINENAKAWASFEGIPEMNHNTLAGLVYPDFLFEKSSAIFLRSNFDHPRNQLRIDLSMQAFLEAGIAVDSVKAQGNGRLAEMFSLLQFGDYLSYYLALDYGVDPTPIEALNRLKRALSQN